MSSIFINKTFETFIVVTQVQDFIKFTKQNC